MKFLIQGHENVRYMLASDRQHVEETAKREFGDKLIINPGPIIHSGHGNTPESIQRLIADHFLLGECDELIISQQSTFGAAAAIRGGRIPFAVDIFTIE